MAMRKQLIAVSALAFALAAGAGFATANLQADAASSWSGFEITATAVRIGNGTKEDPSGLRFKTVASDLTEQLKAQYPDANCYTTISFTSTVVTDENPEGTEKPYSIDVPVSVWTDVNSWNTVLLEIPESDYDTVITAQSFIQLNETTVYETTPVSSSIAKTASLVMAQNNESNEALNKYVANAVESISLNETTGNLTAGDTVQLTATIAPAGFGVLWSSSDPSIATVDGTGKVTAVGAGQATITASMGGKEATYTVTSTIPYEVDFENGANVYIKGSNVVSVGSVVDVDGGSKGVPLTVSGFDVDFGISAAWLANAFANSETTGVSFKLYTDQDGNATYNGYGGQYNTGLDARGTLMYYDEVNNTYPGAVWNTWANSNADCPAKTGGYIKYTISRTKYNAWVEAVQAAGVTSDLYLSVRLGIVQEGKDGFGYGVQAPGMVYIDDLKANIPVKYDPVNNNPLEQDTTFESGTNALINCFAPITEAGLEEVTAGNKAVKLTMPANGFDIFVGFNAAWLENVFVTKSAEKVTYKVYTTLDGWGTYNKFNSNLIGNGEVGYVNNGAMTRLSSSLASVGASEKTDGYLTVTLDKNDYAAWVNAKGSVDSNLYIMMRLGAKEEGKTGFGYGYPVGDIYIDDVTATFPAEPELKDVIDFENGANGYFGTDAAVNASLVGVEEHNGDKALKFQIGSDPTVAISLSHEYMNWVFYQQNAASVSFTISADKALTGTYNKCQMGLVYKTSDGTIKATDVGSIDYVVQDDGTLRMTITKDRYTTRFDENGGKGSALVSNTSIAADAAADSPYYCSIRFNLNAASGILTNGAAFYFDDFTVNY